MSRDLRKLERAEARLAKLETETRPDEPFRIVTVVVKSGEAGRQQLKAIREAEAKKLKLRPPRPGDDSNFPRYELPSALLAGVDSIAASSYIGLLYKWPFDGTTRPQQQPEPRVTAREAAADFYNDD